MMRKNKIKLTRERKSSKIKKQDNKKIKKRRKIRMQDNNSLKYDGENMVFRNIVDVSCGLLVRSCVSITLEKRITSSKGKPSGLLMARCTPVEVSEQSSPTPLAWPIFSDTCQAAFFLPFSHLFLTSPLLALLHHPPFFERS